MEIHQGANFRRSNQQIKDIDVQSVISSLVCRDTKVARRQNVHAHTRKLLLQKVFNSPFATPFFGYLLQNTLEEC